jgi:LysM repeat protein
VSRGNVNVTMGRPLAVWLAATAALAGAVATVPGTWAAAAMGSSTTAVPDVLVAGCASALAAALGWLWLVTTVTVSDVLAGRARSSGGATRRLVLVACGVAVVAGAGTPALAADGGPAGAELLAGLPLPERAVAGTERPSPTPAPVTTAVRPTSALPEPHVVRPGDSLWSVAQAHPVDGTDTSRRWRDIWQANRDVVGDDPDLILPGQALRLPGSRTDSNDSDHDTDGDR